MQFWKSETLRILKLDSWKLVLIHDMNSHKNWFKDLFRAAMDGIEYLDHREM